MLCVVLCLKGGAGVSGMEADPRSTAAKTLGKPCGEGLSVSRLDLGPGFIPHTMLLVVLGINRFVIEEIKSPFRAA